MAKAAYLNRGDNAFVMQLSTFKNNLGSYSAALGLTAAQIAAATADANYYAYVLQSQDALAKAAQQWTTWKILARKGGTPPVSGAPVAPVLPAAAPAVALGIEVRFRALVKLVKASPAYNVAMGEALGIEGAEQTAPDLTTVQPLLTVEVSGGHVNVGWGWNGNAAYLDLCEIQVDRADGHGFGLLTYDSTPDYVDTQPFPAAPVKWTYKAIYRVGDAQVGQWSNPVSVTVGG